MLIEKTIDDLFALVPPPRNPTRGPLKLNVSDEFAELARWYPLEFVQSNLAYGIGAFVCGSGNSAGLLNPFSEYFGRGFNDYCETYKSLKADSPEFPAWFPYDCVPVNDGIAPFGGLDDMTTYFRRNRDDSFDVLWDSRDWSRSESGFVEYPNTSFATFWWHLLSNKIFEGYFDGPVAFRPASEDSPT